MNKLFTKRNKLILFALLMTIVFSIVNYNWWNIAKADNTNTVNITQEERVAQTGSLRIHKAKDPRLTFFWRDPFIQEGPGIDNTVNYQIYAKPTYFDSEDVEIVPFQNQDSEFVEAHSDDNFKYNTVRFSQDEKNPHQFTVYTWIIVQNEGWYRAHWSKNFLYINNNSNFDVNVHDKDGNDVNWASVEEQLNNCDDVDVYISLDEFQISDIQCSNPSKGYFSIKPQDRFFIDSEVNLTYTPYEDGIFAAINVYDSEGNAIEVDNYMENGYKFIMPSSDVTIVAKICTVKEFHKKIAQTFHNVGVRAYYVVECLDDNSLYYYMANDEYLNFGENDNSIGRLIGDEQTFDKWRKLYWDTPITFARHTYQSGWGGLIPPDM